MKKSWGQERDEWVRKTNFPEKVSIWAMDALEKNEDQIYALDDAYRNKSKKEIEELIQVLKKTIKADISLKESDLDDLSLNTPNSFKLQVSVPSSLNYLMKAWAAAEGRDLSSIALQCMEIGLRAMKSKGSIPSVAIERYNLACEKRVALAEVNHIWERYKSHASQEIVLN